MRWFTLPCPAAHRQRGQTVIILAFVILFLILLVGLALDSVRLFILSAQAERTAEAAALAGALYMPTYYSTISPDGQDAIKRVCTLAQENGARLTLLNVVHYIEEYSTEAVSNKRQQVVRQLNELLPLEADLWCKPEFLMAIGEPVQEILSLAKKINADLIVMGAKPRKSLAGNVPHTKTSRIVTGAACPVLTIKS